MSTNLLHQAAEAAGLTREKERDFRAAYPDTGIYEWIEGWEDPDTFDFLPDGHPALLPLIASRLRVEAGKYWAYPNWLSEFSGRPVSRSVDGLLHDVVRAPDSHIIAVSMLIAGKWDEATARRFIQEVG